MFFRQRKKRRSGAATVELAICIPVLAVIVFGSLEGSGMIFLRQALVQSAYETCKQCARTGGTESLARQRGEEVLAFRGIDGSQIDIQPSGIENLARGSQITVTVSAPSDSNSIVSFGPFRGKRITVSAVMIKE